jgi:PhnB protein
MTVQAVPEGFHTITPYLVATDADGLILFLQAAFAAEELHRVAREDGSVMHAQLRIGSSMLMLGGATADWPPMAAALYLYVEDADGLYQRALSEGARSVMPPADQFWGDRMGGVRDSWDNVWWIATHVEDVAPDELSRRAAAVMQAPA